MSKFGLIQSTNLLTHFIPRFFLVFLSVIILGACSDNGVDVAQQYQAPKGLIATAGSRAVELNWIGIANAEKYTIYWSNSPNVNPFNSAAIKVTVPNYEHRGLANGMSYYYVVTVTTRSGESVVSSEVSARPEAPAPEQPQIQGTSEDGRVSLVFNPVAGAIQYRLFWSTQSDTFNQENVIENISSPYIHTGLTNSETYYYYLSAVGEEGKTSRSSQISVVPQARVPFAPVISSAVASSGQVVLTWNDVSNATSFDLYWGYQAGVSQSDSYVTQVNSPYTHAPLTLTAGQSYYYRIRARNNAGVSALSNEVHVTTPATVSIAPAGNTPAIPDRTSINVDVQNGQLTLDWGIEGYDATTGFNIYWRHGNSVLDTNTVLTKGDFEGKITNVRPPYTHVGLVNNDYYYYRISAISNAGESEPSDIPLVSARPEIIKPGVPAGLRAITSDESAILSWYPVQGAQSYIVELTRPGQAAIQYQNVLSPHTLSGLTNGLAYQFRVIAQNPFGPGDPSNNLEFTPKEQVPLAPASLSAGSDDQQIVLRWAPAVPQDVNDPDEVISGYRVYSRNRQGVTPSNGELISLAPTLNNGAWQLSIPNLENGLRYYFVVTALNVGGESLPSHEVWAMPLAPVPNAPADVFAEAGDNQVSINFTDVGASSYNLYWSKADASGRTDSQVITNINPGYVFLDGNSNGITYFFQVAAVGAGGESALSAEVSATPRISAPASSPQNFQAVSGTGQVTINWTNVAGATAYEIYWSTDNIIDPNSAPVLQATDGTAGYVHQNLQNGQAYYYQIAAINTGGRGPLSSIQTALPQVPAPPIPAGFGAIAGDTVATLNWNLSESASSHVLYWHTNNTDPLQVWSSINGITPGFQLTGLTNQQVYYFRLLALNPGGSSDPTSIVSATPQTTPPEKPQGLAAAAGDGQVSINWYSEPDTTYTLYWSTGVADPISAGNVIQNVLPTYIHTGLSNGTVYNYKLLASNPGGDSTPSDMVSASPAAPQSGVPQAFNAEAGDRQIVLRWMPADNETVGTVYKLYWSLQSINSGNLSTANSINNVVSPYLHTGLSNGQVVYYVVTATNPSAAESGPSATISATPQAPVPTAPVLSAEAGNTQNVLTWAVVENATAYRLEWSLAPSFSGSQFIDLASTETTYTHTGLINGEPVHYRIYAQNASGTSAASVPVSASPTDGSNEVVNTAPQFGTAPSPSHTEGDTISPFAVSASDADSDQLLYAASGYPPGIQFDQSTAIFSGTILSTAGQASAYVVTVTVDDQKQAANSTDSITFNWQVNDIVTDPAQSRAIVTPAGSVDLGNAVIIDITANDSLGNQRVEGGDTVSVSITGVNSGLLLPAIVDFGNGMYRLSYTPLAAGTDNYTIQINNVDIGGGPYSIQIANPGPVAPTGLTATPFGENIDLSWNAVPGATYKVYRSATSTVTSASQLISTEGLATTTFSDTQLARGIRYYYAVSAVEGTVEGPLSSIQNNILTRLDENLLLNYEGLLGTFNTAGGAITKVSGNGTYGVTGIEDMTYDTVNQRLFALSSSTKEIVEIDTATGGTTKLLDWNGSGLAYNTSDGLLYSCGTSGFSSINPVTADVVVVSTSYGCPGTKMVYDSSLGVFFGVSRYSYTLRKLDPANGYSLTTIGNITTRSFGLDALVYIPQLDQLMIEHDHYLEVLDKDTAAITETRSVTGATGYNYIEAMAYDRVNNKLYIWDTYKNRLSTVDIAPLGGLLINTASPGIEYLGPIISNNLDTLYSIDMLGKRVISIDITAPNPRPVVVTQLPNTSDFLDLAYDPGVTVSNPNGVLYKLKRNNSSTYDVVELDFLDWVTENRVIVTDTNLRNICFDSQTGNIYGSNSTNEIVQINVTDGSMTVIATFTSGIRSISYNAGDNQLYVTTYVSYGTSDMHRVDKATGVTEFIKTLNFGRPGAIETSIGLTLYGGWDKTSNAQLFSVDTGATNPHTNIVELTVMPSGNLTYVNTANIQSFYTTGSTNSDIYELDLVTGYAYRVLTASAPVGRLAFNRTNQRLYGISSNALVEIDLLTGNLTTVPNYTTEFSNTRSLAFDNNGLLYVSKINGVFTTDIAIGASSFVSLPVSTQAENIYGMAFDVNNSLFAVAYPYLLQIDTAIGAVTNLGKVGTTALSYNDLESSLYVVGGIYRAEPVERGLIKEVGSTSMVSPTGITFDNARRLIYVSNDASRQIKALDVTTGEMSATGFYQNMDYLGIRSVAYNNTTQELFGVRVQDNMLVAINSNDFTIREIGILTVPNQSINRFQLVFDPADSNILYGIYSNVINQVSLTDASMLRVGTLDQSYNTVTVAPNNRMYGYSLTLDTLFEIDTSGGLTSVTSTPVAVLDNSGLPYLTFDSLNSEVLAISPRFKRINPLTGSVSTLNQYWLNYNSLKRNPSNSLIYALDNQGIVSTFDSTFKWATKISTNAVPNMRYLAINSSGELFGIQNEVESTNLYSMDTTNTFNLSSTLGFSVSGFGFHSLSSSYHLVSNSDNFLYGLDITTGVTTQLHSLNVSNYRTLQYSPANRFYYTIRGNSIYALDPFSGQTSSIVNLGVYAYSIAVIQ